MVDRPLIAARLVRSVELSPQTKHLDFVAEGVDRLTFAPGQFISVVQNNAEGREITRAYSFAEPPGDNGAFSLCLNRVSGGFMSNLLCDLPVGGQIRFHGPHGLFTLREPLRDSLLIGTGTGIAPLRSMIGWLFAEPSRHEGRQFWLVFGTRTEASIYYREEFERIAAAHPNFQYIVTLSRPADGWTGPRGYVQQRAAEIAGQFPENGAGTLQAYVCGLSPMVTATRELLKSLGWDRKQIVAERFD